MYFSILNLCQDFAVAKRVAVTLMPRQLQFISILRQIAFHGSDINERFAGWLALCSSKYGLVIAARLTTVHDESTKLDRTPY